MNNRKAPRIRFKGFTDDWEQRKLGEIASSFEYGLNAAAKEFDGKNKYIRITDIYDDSREFDQNNVTSPDIDLLNADSYKLTKGDILFARTGASVGKTYIYKDFDGLVYYAGFLIRAKIKDSYIPEFIFQSTLTKAYEKFIKVTSMRSGQPGVNAQEYSQFELMIPEKPEQDKIGIYFTSLDHLITLHQRKLEKLKIVKKAMLENCFPKNGEKVPKFRFSGFTGDWEQRKLSDLVDVCSGRDYKHLYEGMIPVYGTGGYMLSVSEALSYDRDAIGIGRKGTIDKPYVLKAPFWTVDTLFYAVPEHPECLDFIHDVFQIIDWKKKDESTGVPSLSKEAINDTNVMVPKIDEQIIIGGFSARIDHLITLHQRKLEKLKIIKKSFLEKMFV